MYAEQKANVLKQKVAQLRAGQFDALAMEMFGFQALYNPVYKQYLAHLGKEPQHVSTVADIPFLPIQFFKNHQINSYTAMPEVIFTSSGTTGASTSRHYVYDVPFYHSNALAAFERQFGSIKNYHILAALPSYLEQGGSSLVNMVAHFLEKSGSVYSKFYSNNYKQLLADMDMLQQNNDQHNILLWGVSYALLDLAELLPKPYKASPKLMILETGGMKGRRPEMLKEALHASLGQSFGRANICSEYGMTELLSQAYSLGQGLFEPAPSMKILLREVTDPLVLLPQNSSKTGGINVIDLANVDSCAFVETQDLGQYAGQGQFRVLGRFDNADIRGCNLLVG
jgi:phenylacetate-coenzyme A ligase PaaK-like adenylate-forming protein